MVLKLKLITEFFNTKKEGDDLANRIFEIIEEENIQINHTGGYQIYVDDKIYSFSNYGGIIDPTCYISVFNKVN